MYELNTTLWNASDAYHVYSLMECNMKNHGSGQSVQTIVLERAEENENNSYYQDSL